MRIDGVRLRHLQYFVGVAETLHFGRAAEQLHISQPALTRQVRKLEQELGVELFLRSTRHVELTSAGKTFLRHARHIVDELETAGRALGGSPDRLAVGFAGSATYDLLPRLIKAYQERFPRVELEIHSELLTGTQVELLKSGSLDVGFVRPPIEDQGIEYELFQTDSLVIVLPQDHPLARPGSIALADLSGQPFLAFPEGTTTAGTAFAACVEAGFQPIVVQEVVETHTLVSLIAAGVGVALLPRAMAKFLHPGVVYKEIQGSAPNVQLYVAWRRFGLSSLIAGFLESARQFSRTPTSESSLPDVVEHPQPISA